MSRFDRCDLVCWLFPVSDFFKRYPPPTLVIILFSSELVNWVAAIISSLERGGFFEEVDGLSRPVEPSDLRDVHLAGPSDLQCWCFLSLKVKETPVVGLVVGGLSRSTRTIEMFLVTGSGFFSISTIEEVPSQSCIICFKSWTESSTASCFILLTFRTPTIRWSTNIERIENGLNSISIFLFRLRMNRDYRRVINLHLVDSFTKYLLSSKEAKFFGIFL